MAQTIAELEEDGLVRREQDPGDRRRALVQLTEKGRVVLEAERGRRETWLARAIQNDLSPAEQTTLGEGVELLGRLAER